MIINKITVGYVTQQFDTKTKRFVSQAFIAGDGVSWETEGGESTEEPEDAGYLPLDMKQPE